MCTTNSASRSLRWSAGAAVAGLAITAVASAQDWDLALDFSATENPGPVWSYGYETVLGTGYDVYPFADSSFGLDRWQRAPGEPQPEIAHNPGASALVFATAEVHAGQVVMHPGPLGEYAVSRFTVPAAAEYFFIAEFVGEDFVYPTTTDVHVLVNNVPVYSADLVGYHLTLSSGLLSATLAAGDTIDVAVGYGPNGNYFGDTTGVEFVVSLVPSPGAGVVLALGGIAAGRRRRAATSAVKL